MDASENTHASRAKGEGGEDFLTAVQLTQPAPTGPGGFSVGHQPSAIASGRTRRRLPRPHVRKCAWSARLQDTMRTHSPDYEPHVTGRAASIGVHIPTPCYLEHKRGAPLLAGAVPV